MRSAKLKLSKLSQETLVAHSSRDPWHLDNGHHSCLRRAVCRRPSTSGTDPILIEVPHDHLLVNLVWLTIAWPIGMATPGKGDSYFSNYRWKISASPFFPLICWILDIVAIVVCLKAAPGPNDGSAKAGPTAVPFSQA